LGLMVRCWVLRHRAPSRYSRAMERSAIWMLRRSRTRRLGEAAVMGAGHT
jgi:hypothetical protein